MNIGLVATAHHGLHKRLARKNGYRNSVRCRGWRNRATSGCTAFHVPSGKIERLTPSYFFNRQTNPLDLFNDVVNTAWQPEPPFESGGGGLVSTIDDYFAFSRMMLNKGRHGREQVLSRAAVELMTSDQLTPEQRAGSEIFFGGYSSWGFGMAVAIQRKEVFHTPGRFGWDGGVQFLA